MEEKFINPYRTAAAMVGLLLLLGMGYLIGRPPATCGEWACRTIQLQGGGTGCPVEDQPGCNNNPANKCKTISGVCTCVSGG